MALVDAAGLREGGRKGGGCGGRGGRGGHGGHGGVLKVI